MWSQPAGPITQICERQPDRRAATPIIHAAGGIQAAACILSQPSQAAPSRRWPPSPRYHQLGSDPTASRIAGPAGPHRQPGAVQSTGQSSAAQRRPPIPLSTALIRLLSRGRLWLEPPSDHAEQHPALSPSSSAANCFRPAAHSSAVSMGISPTASPPAAAARLSPDPPGYGQGRRRPRSALGIRSPRFAPPPALSGAPATAHHHGEFAVMRSVPRVSHGLEGRSHYATAPAILGPPPGYPRSSTNLGEAPVRSARPPPLHWSEDRHDTGEVIRQPHPSMQQLSVEVSRRLIGCEGVSGAGSPAHLRISGCPFSCSAGAAGHGAR